MGEWKEFGFLFLGQFLPLSISELIDGFRISVLTDGWWFSDFSDKMNPPDRLFSL